MPLTRIKLTAFADGGISTAKLADNSVTIDKLNNSLDLSGNDTGGTPFTITLPNNSVTTDVVNNDAITINNYDHHHLAVSNRDDEQSP